jgi:hypothetical protein
MGRLPLPGCRPFSFTWELDWRLRQEPVRDENKYRPFLSPAVEVEPQHSGDNGGVPPSPILHGMPSHGPLSPPDTMGMIQPFDQMI